MREPEPRALQVEPVSDATLETWRSIHNLVVPTATLELAEVRERATRWQLTLAYAEGVLVGSGTVRPPGPDGVATVIVRVLPEHRRRGLGTAYLHELLGAARALGARTVATVVLAANADGLAFAVAHGFAEVTRYVLEGQTVAFVQLERDLGQGGLA